MKHTAAAQCTFVFATWAAVGSAADERVLSTARELSGQGMAEYDAGRYDEAAEKLLRVYVTVPLPSSARNAARAVAKQGRLVKAAELFLECTRMQQNELWRADLQQTAQAQCEGERSALLDRIPRLTVVLHGANYDEVNITIDSVQLPTALNSAEQLVDPGTHRITVVRGEQTVRQDIELREGQRGQPELTFGSQPIAPPPPATTPNAPAEATRSPNQRTWAIISGAAGVVGLGVGTGMVLLAEHTYSNAECGENNVCSNFGASDRRSAIRTANWSMLPLGIGLAGLGAGVTLWLTKPAISGSEHTAAGLLVSPNQLGVCGRF